MKKLLCIAALAFFCFFAFAQERIPLLDKVQGQRVHFHYTYSLSQNGAPFRDITDGEVSLEGNAYVLEGLGLKVISNGTTRWSLDQEARELVIEKVVKEDLFTNPALFIASYQDHMDSIKVNHASENSLDVTLTLDNDTQARFKLTGIVFGPPQGKSDFSLDEKSLPSDYVITDLR
jgi:hypothetical protein